MDQHSSHRDEDFLAVPPTGEPLPAPPVANPRRTRWATRLRGPAALVAAGMLAGGVVVGAAAHELSQPASATTAATSTSTLDGAATSGTTDAASGTATRRGGMPGTLGAPNGGGRGGLDGEQHLSATLSAVDASSITVTTAAGESTFTVDASTQVTQDGQDVAISDLSVGQDVVLHVHPSAGGWAVERILAATSGETGSGQAVPGAGSPDDQGGAATSSTTTT